VAAILEAEQALAGTCLQVGLQRPYDVLSELDPAAPALARRVMHRRGQVFGAAWG
jgi:hypothetical protein